MCVVIVPVSNKRIKKKKTPLLVVFVISGDIAMVIMFAGHPVHSVYIITTS